MLAMLAASIGCRRRDEPVRIGVVVGGDGTNAVLLLASDLEAQGGRVGGRRVELAIVPKEYATAAAPSIRVADSLSADPRIIAVVGHSNSAASLAASQIYNARRVVHIAPTTTAPLFSQAGPYSYRLVPDDAAQADFLVRCTVSSGVSRVALVYVNDDYGRGLEAAARPRLAAARVTTVYETPYLEGADSAALHPILEPLVAARPDGVLWLGRYPELGVLRRIGGAAMRALPVLASDGVDGAGVYAAPARYAGVRFVRFVDPATPDPRLQAMRTRYRERFRLETSTEAVLSYDALSLVFAALRAGVRDREGMRAWLDSLGRGVPPFAGVSGPIAFDANGDVARPHQLAEVRADGVRPVPIPCPRPTPP